jgi:hypothetical protein
MESWDLQPEATELPFGDSLNLPAHGADALAAKFRT